MSNRLDSGCEWIPKRRMIAFDNMIERPVRARRTGDNRRSRWTYSSQGFIGMILAHPTAPRRIQCTPIVRSYQRVLSPAPSASSISASQLSLGTSMVRDVLSMPAAQCRCSLVWSVILSTPVASGKFFLRGTQSANNDRGSQETVSAFLVYGSPRVHIGRGFSRSHTV